MWNTFCSPRSFFCSEGQLQGCHMVLSPQTTAIIGHGLLLKLKVAITLWYFNPKGEYDSISADPISQHVKGVLRPLFVFFFLLPHCFRWVSVWSKHDPANGMINAGNPEKALNHDDSRVWDWTFFMRNHLLAVFDLVVCLYHFGISSSWIWKRWLFHSSFGSPTYSDCP